MIGPFGSCAQFWPRPLHRGSEDLALSLARSAHMTPWGLGVGQPNPNFREGLVAPGGD